MAGIVLFGGNFAPKGWAFCAGQLQSIAQNAALFSLLGTTYGGDGVTTFALPNLQSRVPIGSGQGPGLTNRELGEISGSETVTLLISNLPQHNHLITCNGASGDQGLPTSAFWAGALQDRSSGVFVDTPYSQATPTATMAPTALSLVGGSQPHPNQQPYLGLNYIIALVGIFPSRN